MATSLRLFPLEDRRVRAFDMLITLSIGIILAFLIIQYHNIMNEIPNLDMTVYHMATITFWIFLFAFIAQIADEVRESLLPTKLAPINYISLGQSFGLTLLLGAIALSLGLLGFGHIFSSIAPNLPLTSITQAEQIQDPTLKYYQYLFIALIIPFVEEKFFAQTLYPTLASGIAIILGRNSQRAFTLISKFMSLMMTSAIFAMFHLTAYQLNYSLMASAFIFRVLTILLNEVTGYPIISLALHIANNTYKLMG